MLSRIVIAWLVTLPVTILVAGGLSCLFESPTIYTLRMKSLTVGLCKVAIGQS